jgi:hypothetical protein
MDDTLFCMAISHLDPLRNCDPHPSRVLMASQLLHQGLVKVIFGFPGIALRLYDPTAPTI